jgi:hypothetical protein
MIHSSDLRIIFRQTPEAKHEIYFFLSVGVGDLHTP